jgi:hypothetical protein
VPEGGVPTEELVHWGICKYVYSVIAHIRTVLRGIKLLAESGNASTFIIVCRHVFEWNMQSSYVYVNFDSYLKNSDLNGAWDLYVTLGGANTWIREHGTKYAPEFANDELESSIRLKHFVKTYKKHRLEIFGSENVDDDLPISANGLTPTDFVCNHTWNCIHQKSDLLKHIVPQDCQGFSMSA